MFWGVTLDSQKRYSQVTERTYHISMAVLEPRRKGTESSDKYVSLQLEHGNAEYLLCTLQYGKVMQVNLDIVFSKGEPTCFSLNGEGTVHLSGYFMDEDDDDDNDDAPMALSDLSSEYSRQDSQLVSSKYPKANKRNLEDDDDDDDDDEDDDEEVSDSEEDESGLDADSDSVLVGGDDDVKDVTPTMALQKNGKDQVKAKRNVVSLEESKRKNEVQKGNQAKKLKAQSSTPVEISPKKSAKTGSDALPIQKEVQTNNMKEESDEDDFDEESDEEEITLDKQNDDDDAVDEEEDDDGNNKEDSDDLLIDESNSSIGRTPIPKSKDKKSALVSKSIENPFKKSPTKTDTKSKGIADASKKNDLNKPKLTPTPINSKNVNSSTPKNVPAPKNVNGVKIEELRVGSGPVAKSGRFVSIHYIGKLTNGKKFDSNEAPKKPFSFRLGKGEVIKGFDIGVAGMKVGGKRKITIPPGLGYGKQKSNDIPANSTLIFVLELVAVN